MTEQDTSVRIFYCLHGVIDLLGGFYAIETHKSIIPGALRAGNRHGQHTHAHAHTHTRTHRQA